LFYIVLLTQTHLFTFSLVDFLFLMSLSKASIALTLLPHLGKKFFF
jgi:hypothetical protein